MLHAARAVAQVDVEPGLVGRSGSSRRSETSRSARSHQPLPGSGAACGAAPCGRGRGHAPARGREAEPLRPAPAGGRPGRPAPGRAPRASSTGQLAATGRTASGSRWAEGREGTGRRGACSIGGQHKPRMADYAKDVLVDTQWVEDHLNDDSIRIVEVDENPALYAEAHIPGAIGFDWKSDLQDQVRRDFLGPQEFGELFGSRGISNDHTVVLYGDRNNWFAAYTYWYLNYYGHDERQADERPAREVDLRGPADLAPTCPSYEAAAVHRAGGRRRDPRQARRGASARSTRTPAWSTCARPQEYSGELIAMAGYEQEGAQRAGHIPGAASVPWAQAVQEDGTFKSADELRELYTDKGVIDGNADHRLLPHRRALGTHLVRAARAARPRRRQELRRLVDRVGQPGRRADREGRLGPEHGRQAAPEQRPRTIRAPSLPRPGGRRPCRSAS